MPEGDTVYRAARTLNIALQGRTLLKTDFRVPALATTSLAGQTVLEVLSRGKHILLRTDQGFSLHTHFLMEGAWHLFTPGQRWKGGASHEVRIVLETDAYTAVGYRMPVIDVVKTGDEPRLVGHLGPDLLGPDWDAEEALRRLQAAPDVEIGVALLDQRCMSGIGNVFKNEVMFLRGDYPWTPTGAVRDLSATVAMAYRLMQANRDETTRSTTGRRTGDGKFWVFERHGQPCRRCRSTVQKAWQGDDPQLRRLTYWCPSCQPVPGQDPGPGVPNC